MGMKQLPPLDYLRQCLRYDAETGKLFWLARPRWMFDSDKGWKISNTKFAGKEAFTSSNDHGRHGRISDEMYSAHRIAFYLGTGSQPVGEIDHINGDPFDNRLENLRDVSKRVNQQNRSRLPRVRAMGVKVAESGRWIACIRTGGRDIHLGTWDTFEEAAAARKAAQKVLGFHPNHGRAPRGEAA